MKQSYVAPWSQLYGTTGKSLAVKPNVAMSFCQSLLLALGKSTLKIPVKPTQTDVVDGCNLGTNQCFPEREETKRWVSCNVTPPTGNFQPFPSSFLPQHIYSKYTKLSTGGGGTQRQELEQRLSGPSSKQLTIPWPILWASQSYHPCWQQGRCLRRLCQYWVGGKLFK